MASVFEQMSLRSKIIGLVVASVLATAALIGGIDYLAARKEAVARAQENLASATRLASSKLETAYELMRNDALVVSRTPPISGLIRSTRNHGFDTQDESTTELWRKRLATIFRSLMVKRPHYTQMRYIGIANNGKEIVHVDRLKDGTLVATSEENLQHKSNRDYFKDGVKLKEGQHLFSNVGYNQEHGKIDPTYTPTLRVVLPIFDDEHRQFGLIVVNSDYEAFLRPILLDMPLDHVIYLADRRGSYLQRDLTGTISSFYIAGRYTHAAPDFISAFVSGEPEERLFRTGAFYGYEYPLKIVPGRPDSTIGLFFLKPRNALMANANRQADYIAVITVLLAITAVTVGVVLAKQCTRPLALVTEQIRRIGGDDIDVSGLPVEARDEVGEMARAFRDLVHRLDLACRSRTEISHQLDSILSNSVDGVVIINEEGSIERVNGSLLDIFGYEEEELIGRNVSLLMPEPNRSAHDGYLRRYREAGIKKYLASIRDEKARHKDGSIIPISLAINETRLGDRRIFSAIVRDMTVIAKAHLEVRRYADELERSNQELDQFAYVASHDLKAPLRVIDSMSGFLEEDLEGKLNDKDQKYLRVLRNRVQRMDKLLDDLLAYSRVGRSKGDGDDEIVTVSKLVEDILALLSPPQSFTIEAAPEFDAIRVARMPLQQVLYNLINNAIKHHDRETGRITLRAEPMPGRLRLTVEDDGPGIAPQYQQQIFEMFKTLKPRDEVEGSGMGLAIVKKHVELVGGVIKVSSGQERGTAFTLTWPVQEEGSLSEAAA